VGFAIQTGEMMEYPTHRPARLIVALALAILVAVIGLTWPDLEFGLALEQSPLGWFQAVCLVACSAVAGTMACQSDRREANGWGLMALAFLAAALDERFMGHERLQEWLYYGWLKDVEGGLQLAHSVTSVYGLAGLFLLAWLWRHTNALARRWCLAAVLVGLAAVTMDMVFETVTAQMLEEVLEYLSETLLLAGLFTEAGIRAYQRR